MKINQTDEVQSEIEDMIHYYSLFDPYNNKDGGEMDTILFIICYIFSFIYDQFLFLLFFFLKNHILKRLLL